MKKIILLIGLFIIFCSFNSIKLSSIEETNDSLFLNFSNPPAEARPSVFWWWNNNMVTKREIVREIKVLKDGGFGGFIIIPIGYNNSTKLPGYERLEWLSPEWNNMVKIASQEARKMNMIPDLSSSMGWPCGGKFLNPKHYIQRITTNQFEISNQEDLEKKVRELMVEIVKGNNTTNEYLTTEIAFLRLIPTKLKDIKEIVRLDPYITKEGTISYKLPEGKYYLVAGTKQKGYRRVAGGSAMDYYNKEATLSLLSNLMKITQDTGVKFSELIRALYVDSIELSGANWSDTFSQKFKESYGYQLEDWFPFIFYLADESKYINNYFQPGTLSPEVKEKVTKARYDFYSFLNKQLFENFDKVVRSFCNSNGILLISQAYGWPWNYGISEGYLYFDIPSGNNWLYSLPGSVWPPTENIVKPYDSESFCWSDIHGYMLWNKYAAAGAHLTGKRIVDCESMTNVSGKYDITLEDIKQADDMNFITGINHTTAHGFNFSPPEAGKPGWVKYGTFFSEYNTWWKYVNKWTEYNSRLSAVFQKSNSITDIGIIGPTSEIWGEVGLSRFEMQTTPPYFAHLWESFSNIGTTCDYLSEEVLDLAFSQKNSIITHFPYKLLVFTDVKAISTRTVEVLKQYIAKGGKVAFVGSIPERSLSLKNEGEGNWKISSEIESILKNYPQQVFHLQSPASYNELISWSENLLKTVNFETAIIINDPKNYVYQNQFVYGDDKLYFFTNSNREKDVHMNVKFPAGKLTPWIWDAEKGIRKVFPNAKPGTDRLNLHLKPLESMLIVYDKTANQVSSTNIVDLNPNKEVLTINSDWDIFLSPFIGKKFTYMMTKLTDFILIPELADFAGEAVYSTKLNLTGNYSKLNLGNVNRGTTEVLVNGKSLGICWYGKHEYDISNLIKQGSNTIEIKYTSVMHNFLSKDKPKSAFGITGPIVLIK